MKDAFEVGRAAAELYGDAALQMVLVCGSAAPGLSDGSSDIDVYLFSDRAGAGPAV